MKTYNVFLPLAFLLIANSSIAEDKGECKASWAVASYLAEDERLNIQYNRLLIVLDGVDNFEQKSLIAAQRSWLTYRDNHCRIMWNLALRIGENCRCMIKLTKNRNEELESLLFLASY